MLLRNFIIACWVVFAAYWAATAASTKRSVERQSWASRSWHLLLLGLAFALLLAIWARRAIGSNWSAIVTLKKDHALVTRGPYRYVRHPIYSAILMMFFA